ncbi:MAG: methyl-accepting chemotaxis protein [Gammaproteobacteria bacterium]|nr:methyl-accepting chemotaxis protein [Gammaproteobacteria bacterium]
MKALFKPAIAIMNRMSYPVKFAVLNLIVIIPMLIQTWSLIANHNADIVLEKHELIGLDYIKLIRPLIEDIPKHRGMTHSLLKGNTSFKDKITSLQKKIDSNLATLDSIDKQLTSKLFTENKVQEIIRLWKSIKSDSSSQTTEVSFNAHSKIINKLKDLLVHVSITSEIALDPKIDGSLLGKVLVSQLPELTDTIGQSRGVASGIATEGKFTPQLYIQLSVLINQMKDNIKTLTSNLQIILKENPNLENALSAIAAENVKSINQFIELLERDLIQPETIQADSASVFNSGTNAINKSFKLYDAITPELDNIFNKRIKRSTLLRNAALLIAISVILALSYLFTGLNISVNQSIRQVGEATKKLSDGDMTTRLNLNTKDEMSQIAHNFNEMVEKFEALIQQIMSATTQLGTAAEELSMVAKESAISVDRQRAETDQVATAMNEMAATVQEVSRNASAAAGSATSADNDAQGGKVVVQQTSEAISQLATEVEHAAEVIHKLEKDSEDIGAILDVIKDIAEQTNLLALNAAIEAARAGEQGRGFAVVADEVRTLASRTQQSTQEIEQMITRLQDGAQNAVSVMEQGVEKAQKGASQANEAAEALDAITRAVTTISEMNTMIASASEQQSAVAEEMNKSIVSISQVSEQTADGARQTTSSSDELAKLAGQLQELISQFKIAS